jgi:5-methylcytosine-specific restriction endonuclease McrA
MGIASYRSPHTTEVQIRAYWAAQGLWAQKDFDSPQEFMEKGVCMACGWKRSCGIERAHIFPRMKGGADSPANLHMLCRDCHNASEYLEGERYWAWFFAMNQGVALIAFGVTHGFVSIDDLKQLATTGVFA